MTAHYGERYAFTGVTVDESAAGVLFARAVASSAGHRALLQADSSEVLLVQVGPDTAEQSAANASVWVTRIPRATVERLVEVSGGSARRLRRMASWEARHLVVVVDKGGLTLFPVSLPRSDLQGTN